MDKAEYRVMLDQITRFYDAGNYIGALPIVKEIDWRRVKSVRTLCMVSEIYEANEQLEESLRILKIAYKRASISKTVLYRLADISARLGNYKDAITYYREFEEISPMDSSKYILKYEIYRAKGASLEEQIQILEEYKEREYTEQWAYELAKLYSEAGMKDACVETCDDLILWFSEGTYVKRAMELKQTYTPLTASQNKKYQEICAQKSQPKWEDQTADLERMILANTETAYKPTEKTENLEELSTTQSESAEPVVKMDPARMQDQLADSIRAVFSGINKESEVFADAEEEEDIKIYNPAETDMSGYEIKELEPESVEGVEQKADAPAQTDGKQEEERDDQIAGQLSFTDFEQPQEFDLEALLAETSNALAQEVASGEFEMTDKSVEEEAARKAEEEAQLYEKETDESLGLTREFNFQEELKKTSEESEAILPEMEDLEEPAEELTIDKVDLEDLERLLQEQMSESNKNLEEADENESDAKSEAEAISKKMDYELEFITEEKRLQYVPVEPRELRDKEKEIFSYFAKIPGMSQQITETISDVHNNAGDKTSKSGNFLIIGRQGSGKTKLYESMVLAICNDLEIKAAKMAKIIGRDLNKKDPAVVVSKLAGGFLVIEGAGEMNNETVEKLSRAMEFRTDGLIVVLEDEKADLFAMLDKHPELSEKFTSSIKIPVFTNDELVTFAKTYASENGYKMDEMGVLALYTKIGDNQKNSEPVTVGKVKDIMDEAIEKANRGSRRFGRKFSKNAVDEDNRILLLEKDFD